ncbi:MAG TPA: hypothetical protein VFD92_05410 [Candidatus Binatia bacterium]|nr:hypothetical protein [Candidatus Binatia bacterium]
MKRSMIAVAVLFLAACAGNRYGAVTPAPPGPVDLVRMAFGDYSGRCPATYQYCSGSSAAICCPIADRCEEDSGGLHCVPRAAAGGAYAWDTTGQPPPPACGPDEMACSYAGRTTCCASNLRCCASDGGPACCASY